MGTRYTVIKSIHSGGVVSGTACSGGEVYTDVAFTRGLRLLRGHKVWEFIAKDGKLLTLSQMYKSLGITSDLLDSSEVVSFLCDVAEGMFPCMDLVTGERDIDRDIYYTEMIPLVVLSGCIFPQVSDVGTYFNGGGTISIAEVLYGLNAVENGRGSSIYRKASLDGVSAEGDYFNEGYNACIEGYSSYFFQLYRREELFAPITRVELAYLFIVCYSTFADKSNLVCNSEYYLGLTLDWGDVSEVLSGFSDGFDYAVSKVVVDCEHDVVSLDLRRYRGDCSMTEYREKLISGEFPIPFPMFCSLLELSNLHLFCFEGMRLDPLREVSRGEFCYFLTMVAKMPSLS